MTQSVLQVETPPTEFETKRVASHIVGEARRDAGFIITFKKSWPEPFGFGFLAVERNKYVAIHGRAPGIGERLTCEIVCFEDGLAYDEIVRQYLERTAVLIDIPPAKLIQDLCRKSSIWRFFGYLDEEGGYTMDTHRPWQALWGRLVEIATPERLPGGAPQFAIDRLRECAFEGQIVLEK